PKQASPAAPPRNATGDIAKRVRAYLATMPSAIEGQGGDKQTFTVACVLVKDFALTESEAWPFLLEYNDRCQPKWTERELRHKLSCAVKAEGPVGRLVNNDDKPTERSKPHAAPRPTSRPEVLSAASTPPAARDDDSEFCNYSLETTVDGRGK